MTPKLQKILLYVVGFFVAIFTIGKLFKDSLPVKMFEKLFGTSDPTFDKVIKQVQDVVKDQVKNPESYRGRDGLIMTPDDLVSDVYVLFASFGRGFDNFVFNDDEESINKILNKHTKSSFKVLRAIYSTTDDNGKTGRDLIVDIKKYTPELVKWWEWLWK